MSTVSSCLCKDVEELTASFQPRGGTGGRGGSQNPSQGLGASSAEAPFPKEAWGQEGGAGNAPRQAQDSHPPALSLYPIFT